MSVMFRSIDVEMVWLFETVFLGGRLASNGCETVDIYERVFTSRSLRCIAFEDVGQIGQTVNRIGRSCSIRRLSRVRPATCEDRFECRSRTRFGLGLLLVRSSPGSM